jgi:hypothetical protein
MAWYAQACGELLICFVANDLINLTKVILKSRKHPRRHQKGGAASVIMCAGEQHAPPGKAACQSVCHIKP